MFKIINNNLSNKNNIIPDRAHESNHKNLEISLFIVY